MALPYPSYSFKSAVIMSTTLSIRSRKRFPAPKIGALKIIGEAKGSELGWVFRNVFRRLHHRPSRQAAVSEPTGSKKRHLFPSVHGAGGWARVRRPYISTAFLTAAAAERLRNVVLAVFTPLDASEKGFDSHNLICFQAIPPGRCLVQTQARKGSTELSFEGQWCGDREIVGTVR